MESGALAKVLSGQEEVGSIRNLVFRSDRFKASRVCTGVRRCVVRVAESGCSRCTRVIRRVFKGGTDSGSPLTRYSCNGFSLEFGPISVGFAGPG